MFVRGASLLGLLLGLTVTAEAQGRPMDIALSRLRVPNDGACLGTYCEDNDAWRRIATDFAGSLIPPLLTPARTRGPRSFYVGMELFMTPIVPGSDHWRRGTEGPGTASSPGMNNFVEPVLVWTRVELRKALPFGFELGTSMGFLPNSSYATLGLEVRWAILEGWLSDDWWVPDLAVRGAVQTLLGDQEFNTTVASVDLTLSNSVILGDELELSPYIAGQFAWTFADTELVDLTPEVNAFADCDPVPGEAEPMCRGPSSSDYNNNVVFDSIRTMRMRMIFGLQARYEVFTLTGAFSFDLVKPGEWDSSIPADIDRQYTIDAAFGLSF